MYSLRDSPMRRNAYTTQYVSHCVSSDLDADSIALYDAYLRFEV
jgi:hypothetical protein